MGIRPRAHKRFAPSLMQRRSDYLCDEVVTRIKRASLCT